jgi:hypothetical protein
MAYVGPLCLIIPEGVKLNGSDVFNVLDPDSGGAATFAIRLSADGAEPVTYWGARTMLEEATYNALTNMTTQQFKAYVDQVATQRGREPVGSVTAFKNALLMSGIDADFFTFAAANGLQPIRRT